MRSNINYHSLLLVLILFFGSSEVTAQQPKKVPAKPFVKFKPPVVNSFLGKYTGQATVITPDEGKVLISQPLIIKDEKNTVYKLVTYQFVYKRVGVTEDEATGKLSPQSDIVAERFETPTIPPLWQNIIKEDLHKGEEFYYLDIIVLDDKGRRFFAPDLKITIQ